MYRDESNILQTVISVSFTFSSVVLQIDQYKKMAQNIPAELTSEGKVSEQCHDSKVSLNVSEREALLAEIESLKEQLKNQTTVSTTDSLLDQLRNGSTDQEYELDKERQKWMESEQVDLTHRRAEDRSGIKQDACREDRDGALQ